jgi:Protein of unknown function (DUF1501)
MSRPSFALSRREWLRLSSAGVLGGGSLSGWLERLAAAAGSPQRKRACILLWMSGGPSQTDTFDVKPGEPFREIATSAPGLRFSELLPCLSKQAKHLALVRSMSTKVADHGVATYYLRTGYLPQGPIQYPPLGALLSKELNSPEAFLPGFVSIAPTIPYDLASRTPGFLGPKYAPLIVGKGNYGAVGLSALDQALQVDDLHLPSAVKHARADARIELLQDLQRDFVAGHPGVPALGHQASYERAVRLMRSAGKAFDFHEEPSALRDRYGHTLFGQGCLLARRLVERSVPFVEVVLENWDTHRNSSSTVKALCRTLDAAWSTLLEDLDQRGLLDTTVVVWMGEFGRTPKIVGDGRDHFADAWSTVLCGGGIRGGTVYGQTSADGRTVKDKPVSVPDLLATVVKAVGVDPTKQNMSNIGRPIRIADAGSKPIQELLA